MSTTEYEAKRAEFWSAQTAFREYAIKEIDRLRPPGVETIILTINDAPRLAFSAFIDADGEKRDAEDVDLYVNDGEVYETIDQIANDMELTEWDEAANYLFRFDYVSFQIGKIR